MSRSVVVGTAGHIDHGKTALVRALTGIDADRLPEEKRRGITIDLGYAALDVKAPDGGTLRISFVDVPGHALFIRNMLAGTGCVPAVMLIIAADEGVMPQTREHLAICQLLGISDGFTVITKSDLVPEPQIAEIRSQVSAFVKGTFLEGKAMVPASAHLGSGLSEVRAELSRLALHACAAERTRPMRLPIDRTFVKKGFGTVVTGTLLSGEIRTGETLALEPGARHIRVRGLQTHGESEDLALAGSRVAVNLSGVEAGDIARGQTLIVAGGFPVTDTLDAEITLLADAPLLKHRGRLHFHAFTSEVMGIVTLYGNGPIQPGNSGLARLRLSSPVVLSPGDRFVLRQPLPAGTIGGGRVLDADTLAHARKSETQAWLEQLSTASQQEQFGLRVQRRGPRGIRCADLACEMGITMSAARELGAKAITSGEIITVLGELFLSREALISAGDQAIAHIRTAPSSGLKRSELQSQMNLPAEVLNSVVDRLVADGRVSLSGEVVSLAGAAAAVSNKDAQKLHAISTAYQSAGLAAPSVREAAEQVRMAEPEMRRLITLLIREKTLVRMGSDDAFVHTEPLRQLTDRLASMRGKTLDVTAFKTLTGLTRKHAIPLLEYLDRERITRKMGDSRMVL
ncbi:MAG TPA: selenocysteine-specific translation elongation factor [Terracidiphilus sp.]|jgi:selenocysteine-specific elongation factor